jgi:hypothetical protein
LATAAFGCPAKRSERNLMKSLGTHFPHFFDD